MKLICVNIYVIIIIITCFMKDIKKVSKMDEKLKTNARQVVNHTHKLVLFVLDFNRYKSLKRKK